MKKSELNKIIKEEVSKALNESANEKKVGSAEVRRLEKNLSPENKEALAKALKAGKIKTSGDLMKWRLSKLVQVY
tara:strand:+ start:296 stop:520 length:225 start_codon:yes stop_codon:yes gene_type:complete